MVGTEGQTIASKGWYAQRKTLHKREYVYRTLPVCIFFLI
jgi:hypothetical protein